jgi:transposase
VAPSSSPATLRVDDVAPGGRVTPTSLELPEGISWEQWRRLGDQLARRGDSIMWWIADHSAYGERQYRRDYGPALEQLYERKSLRNLAYVARNVDPSVRREELSFSHHAEVAPLDPEQQAAWLESAIAHAWSKQELRDQLADAGLHARRTGEPVDLQPPPPVREVRRVPDPVQKSYGSGLARPAAMIGLPVEQRRAEAHRLRAEGHALDAIAGALGVGRQVVTEYLSQPADSAPAPLRLDVDGKLLDLCVAAAERVGLDPVEWALGALETAALATLE